MSILQEVNENDFEKQVVESNVPVVVDFWAPWCGPCRMLTPVLESLAVKMDGRAKVVKLNTDENFTLARKFGIMAIPTIVVFRGGHEAQRLTGFLPESELETWLKNAIETEPKVC